MEFKLGNGTLMLPELHITVMAIVIIYLLAKWSKELETGRIKIFIYFLVAAYVMPVLSYSTLEYDFQLWIPAGFLVVFFYIHRKERYHPAKMKASVLGLFVAIYQIAGHMF